MADYILESVQAWARANEWVKLFSVVRVLGSPDREWIYAITGERIHQLKKSQSYWSTWVPTQSIKVLQLSDFCERRELLPPYCPSSPVSLQRGGYRVPSKRHRFLLATEDNQSETVIEAYLYRTDEYRSTTANIRSLSTVNIYWRSFFICMWLDTSGVLMDLTSLNPLLLPFIFLNLIEDD